MDPPKERVRLTEPGVDFQLCVMVGVKQKLRRFSFLLLHYLAKIVVMM